MLLHRVDTRAVPHPDLFSLTDEMIRIFPEEFQLSFKLAGFPFVIRIQERDPFAPCFFDSEVPGGGGAVVFLMKNPYLGSRDSGLVGFLIFTNLEVRGANPADETFRIVRGAIIDDDKFKIRTLLREDGIDCTGQDRFAVVSV